MCLSTSHVGICSFYSFHIFVSDRLSASQKRLNIFKYVYQFHCAEVEITSVNSPDFVNYFRDFTKSFIFRRNIHWIPRIPGWSPKASQFDFSNVQRCPEIRLRFCWILVIPAGEKHSYKWTQTPAPTPTHSHKHARENTHIIVFRRVGR